MCTIVSVVERQRNRSRRLGAITNGLFCREREHKAAIGLMSERERAARRGRCLCQTEHLHCDRKCLKDSYRRDHRARHQTEKNTMNVLKLRSLKVYIWLIFR